MVLLNTFFLSTLRHFVVASLVWYFRTRCCVSCVCGTLEHVLPWSDKHDDDVRHQSVLLGTLRHFVPYLASYFGALSSLSVLLGTLRRFLPRSEEWLRQGGLII